MWLSQRGEVVARHSSNVGITVGSAQFTIFIQGVNSRNLDETFTSENIFKMMHFQFTFKEVLPTLVVL